LSVPSSWLPAFHICNSYAAAQNARAIRSPFVPERLSVVRNALDLDRYSIVPLPRNGQTRIVGVGSLTHRKRWDRLLVAASVLTKKGFDFVLRIAGDGPLRQALQSQATALGLSDRVEFLGYVEDIPRVLADSTFVAHAADHEGCPNAVMEGMACGRAVVATDAGDVPSLVDDRQTGFVAPRTDDRVMIDRMSELMTDRELCRRMGLAGRAKAEREFGLDRLFSETLAAYRSAGWKAA